MGHSNTNGLGSFDGLIDDAKIYNYVRTQKQIVQDMNAGHPAGGSPISSAAYYLKFDDLRGSADSANNCSFTARDDGYRGPIDGNWGEFGGSCIPVRTDGKFGRALKVSDTALGQGNTSILDGLTAMTLSFWIKPEGALNTSRGLVGKAANTQFSFFVTTGASSASDIAVCIYGNLTDSSCTAGATYTTSGLGLAANVWSYITIVYDGSQSNINRVKVYKNLQPYSGSITTGTTIPPNLDSGSTADLSLGPMVTTQQPASYDEFKLYPYALTTSEMQIDYNHSSALALGSVFTDSNNVASNSASMAFCPPGDSCSAPIQYWPMDENTGTAVSDSGSNPVVLLFNGTSNPSWGVGKIGSGLNFRNTSGQYISDQNSVGSQVGDHLGNTAAYTFEAWFKRRTTTSYITLGTQATACSTGMTIEGDNASGNFTFAIGNGSGCRLGTFTATADTNWHHVAVVYDGSLSSDATKLKGFLDGVQQSLSFSGAGGTPPSSVPTSLSGNSSAMFIGTCGLGCGEPTDGLIDDVRLYKYARTPAEVAWDYSRGQPLTLWKFNECQGTTAHDEGSVATVSGTLTGGNPGTCQTSSTAWGNGAVGKYNASLSFGSTPNLTSVASANTYPFSLTAFAPASWGAWIFPTSSAANQGVIDKQNQFRVYLNGSNVPICSLYYSGAYHDANNTTAVSLNAWSHVLCTYDNTNIKTYVNGNLVNTTRDTNGIGLSTSNLYAGLQTTNSVTFTGQIDDVRVYGYTLTPIQVQTLYNQNSAVRFGPATGNP